jgi:FkbM family methyltransferase
MRQLATTRYGTMECLSSDSVVSRALLRYGEWAQLELDLIAGLVRPGNVALDVGAFLGTHTLALAAMVGPTGQVHSFEPRAAIRAVLEGNVQRNCLLNVTVHPCALGAAAASLALPAIDVDSEANFGGLALEAQAVQDAPTESIRIERLDDLGLGLLDFIKLDAEGMEAEVLAGARAVLASYRPVLLAECNDLDRGSRTHGICRELGYEVYGVLSPAYNPANLRGDAENIFGAASEASLVALPPNRAAELHPAVRAQLVPLPTLDDLTLLLLHKVQYPVEVLALSEAAHLLGMDYASPRSRHSDAQVVELHAMLQAAEARVAAAEQQAELAGRAAAAAQAVAANLQRRGRERAVRGWIRRLRNALR